MKKILLMLAGLLILTLGGLSVGNASGPDDKRIGHDWYSGDMYKMSSEEEHEKKFPHGHKNLGPEDEKNCYFDKAAAAYFCQFDWEE